MNCSWATVLYNGTDKYENCVENSLFLEYPCSNSYQCNPFFVTFECGTYLFEVYGAEGGGPNGTTGKGGGIKAYFRILGKRSYFAYVGAKGTYGTNTKPPKTFGGGGAGYSSYWAQVVGSGGGASDIRRRRDDLSSRLIVAGGGGAGADHYDSNYNGTRKGGAGSGSDGLPGTTTARCGTPGSGALMDKVGDKGDKGGFGFGGSSISGDGSGGGGGYYGGNGGCWCAAPGGGGSGYVSKSLKAEYIALTGVREGNGLIKITKVVNSCPSIGRSIYINSYLVLFLLVLFILS